MLAGVLPQCQAFVHLELCDSGFGKRGAESFARVLEQWQCPALASLDLTSNWEMGWRGTVERLRAAWPCPLSVNAGGAYLESQFFFECGGWDQYCKNACK